MTKITQTESPNALCTTHKVCSSVQSVPQSSILVLPAGVSSGHCLLAAGLVCCALLSATPAHAGPPPPTRSEQDDGPRNERPQAKQPGHDGQRPVVRQEDAEGRRRAAQMQESYAARAAGIDAAKRNSRLTPEERRDLRRQINEAGQDIYARPPNR